MNKSCYIRMLEIISGNFPRTFADPQQGVDARFIDELEARGVERRDLCLIGRARLLDPVGLALIGVERLFSRGNRRAMTRRPLVGTLTRRLRWAQSRSHNSASVASGCA
jgi:hypothetical protein